VAYRILGSLPEAEIADPERVRRIAASVLTDE
jgi:hypothetical protein